MNGPPSVDLEAVFPGLVGTAWRETSCTDEHYNCFAWAGGDNRRLWSPMGIGSGWHWPPGPVALPTMKAFKDAYSVEGYEECDDGSLEDGYEKIAFFGHEPHGVPRHAARQLPSGKWTSKMGDDHDIEHASVGDVGGQMYGHPQVFMRRPLRQPLLDAPPSTSVVLLPPGVERPLLLPGPHEAETAPAPAPEDPGG